jgi:hypothetical protein
MRCRNDQLSGSHSHSAAYPEGTLNVFHVENTASTLLSLSMAIVRLAVF